MNISIVIPNYNGKHLLADCVHSIRKNTAIDYEIIVVDNGSQDDSLAFCMQQNIPFVSLPENRGFAAACNYGIQVASGDYVVLLNNDVMVAPYWLDAMMTCMHQTENTGIVGPMSNYISGPQLLPFSYTNLEDTAEKLRKKFNGKSKEVHRLVGLCLLIKREVIDRIGLLDERFSLGHYEDDDYCLRARHAGYQLKIAQDAFVFHYGSSSFNQLGQERLNQLIERNRQLFIEKWGVDPNTLMQ